MSIGMFLDFPSLLFFPWLGMVRIFGRVFRFWETRFPARFCLDTDGTGLL